MTLELHFAGSESDCECAALCCFAVERVLEMFPVLRPFDPQIRNALGNALRDFHASRRPEPRPEPLPETTRG